MHEIAQYPRSAYLHIPFCHRRCFYCDFVIEPIGDKAQLANGLANKSITSYLEILKREIWTSPKGTPLSTIYIGGGTPSLLSPAQIKSLVNHLRNHFGFQDGFELTLEIDPASFNRTSLDGYLDAGINRLSLGGQSFDDEVLVSLGRNHTFSQLLEACSWIQEAYFYGDLSTWSLDLIQNLPGHNLITWEKQLELAISTSAPHFSVYDLAIEPGTVFASQYKKGQLNLPKEEVASKISMLTSSKLKEAGFSRYEISNYALPGHASRHNRVYWSGAGWWGFGQGATSSALGERFSRPRLINDYVNWVKNQETQLIESSLKEIKNKPIDFDEQVLVGLRRREGIDLEKLAIDWGWNKQDRVRFLSQLIDDYWDDYLKRRLLIRNGMRFYLSDPIGMEISNRVLVEMFSWWQNLPSEAVVLSNLAEL